MIPPHDRPTPTRHVEIDDEYFDAWFEFGYGELTRMLENQSRFEEWARRHGRR